MSELPSSMLSDAVPVLIVALRRQGGGDISYLWRAGNVSSTLLLIGTGVLSSGWTRITLCWCTNVDGDGVDQSMSQSARSVGWLVG